MAAKKKKKAKEKIKKRDLDLLLALLGFFAFISIVFLASTFYSSNRIYSGIYIAGIDVSGKTKEEAKSLLDDKIINYEGAKFGNRKVKATDIGITFNVDKTVDTAYFFGRSSNIIKGFKERFKAGLKRQNIGLELETNEKLSAFILDETDKYNTKVGSSKIAWKEGIEYTEGENGKRILITETKLALLNNVKNLNDNESLREEVVKPDIILNKKDIAMIEDKVKKPIVIDENGKSRQINPGDMIGWFILHNEKDDYALTAYLWPKHQSTKVTATVNSEEVSRYVEKLSKGIDVSAKNAVLKGENGKIVVDQDSKDGLELDKADATSHIISAVNGSDKTVRLKVATKKAEVREDNLAELGIKELVSVGTSNFSGSPSNRIHNFKTGASKFNGVIIKPGEAFSFNKILGPVDASTGYLPELVIKENKTVPEYGGGLCQVSSTSFRAALNAGFPILERVNHAYPVVYYYPLGTDATIYLPSPDFKFKNDSTSYILIQTSVSGNTLKFEFYGTKKPVVSKFASNPEGQDAVLKVEDIKPLLYDQEWAGKGSVRSIWYRLLYEGDKLIKTDTFRSSYESPDKYPH